MDQRPRPNSRSVGWKCSSCGELITSVEDGWVEWLATEREHGTVLHGLKLIHGQAGAGNSGARSCRHDPRAEFGKDQSLVEGLPLARFVGPDGLMLLLSFLAVGEIPKDEVLELTKRVQIPGYELTRELFDAVGMEYSAPAVMRGYYLQVEIRALLRWAMRDIKSAP